MHKQGFLTPLVDSGLPDGKRWRLCQNLVWQWRDGRRETVPMGYITDYASVPDLALLAGIVAGLSHIFGVWPLFWIAILICILSKRIDDDPRTDAGAAFHDKDYFERKKSRLRADCNFVIRMRAKKVGWWKCILYWINLRLFGWFRWYSGIHIKKPSKA